ncbi:MAG: hypothetical protein EXQ55_04375 [Acidobacteria bacterium]|nr:hypothetical protein [Acidobacteriota bacterium]
MRDYRVGAAGFLALHMVVSSAMAQTPSAQPADPELVAPPNWAFNDLACAPHLIRTPPKADIRVVGSQDIIIKNMFGPGDTLVVSGGSAMGLEPGQRYFVRRLIKTFAATGPDAQNPITVHTAGWIQILGVDTALATATIVHACEGILLDDYMEPFVAPMVPVQSSQGNTPFYENMGHIMTGVEASQIAGVGQLMNIDLGSNTGVVAGQRFLVFRDKRDLIVPTRAKSAIFLDASARMPLVEVGEVVVVAVREDDATVKVLAQKDAIRTGDLIAEIR